MTEPQIYAAAIEKFGIPSREDKLVEEMAELIQAIMKHRGCCQAPGKYNLFVNIHEEIADVEILIAQLKTKLDVNLINQIKQQKLDYLKSLL